MKTARRWSFVFAAVSFLGACDSAPFEVAAPASARSLKAQLSMGAERVVEENLYDHTGSIFQFACSAEGEPLPITDGEEILIEGQIFERIVYLVDGAEGMHFKLNTMPVGYRGVGLTSGEEFRVTENQKASSNSKLAGGSGSYRQVLKMVGRDTGRTFWMVFSGHYRIDADGEVHLTRDRERVECRA